MSYAKVILCGNIGRDPELRYTSNGNAVATFTVAVNRKEKGKTEPVTDWYRVTCWGSLAEEVPGLFNKGSKVVIEGRLAQNQYTDKQGQVRTSFDVTADKIVADEQRKVKQEEPATKEDIPLTEDDIPF